MKNTNFERPVYLQANGLLAESNAQQAIRVVNCGIRAECRNSMIGFFTSPIFAVMIGLGVLYGLYLWFIFVQDKKY